MKYSAEMGFGAVIYIPSLIKIASGIQKLTGGGNIYRHTEIGWRYHKLTLGQ
jgi:hypothetical protein